jgi:hypothetical protein
MHSNKINCLKLEIVQTLRSKKPMIIRMSLNYIKGKRIKVFNQTTDIRVQERQSNKLIK